MSRKFDFDIDTSLMRDAVIVFGWEPQLRMLQEECMELAHAVSKHCRQNNASTAGALIEEMADVLIVMEQVKGMLFSWSMGRADAAVQLLIDAKQVRLMSRIEERKQEILKGNKDND